MPWDRRKYPHDWQKVRVRIMLRSAGHCEGSPLYPDCRAEAGKPHPVTGSIVVLTTAHYPDPDPANTDDANLHGWCQRCHLGMDRPHHLAKQKANRQARKRRAQPALPGIEE